VGGPARSPPSPRRIEDRLAADEHVFIRAEGQAGRRAELDPIRVLHLFCDRIDAEHPSVLRGRADLRNGEVELLSAGIPYWLFGAVGRVHAMGQVKGYPVLRGIRRGQGAVLRIERDERAERWTGRVVDYENERILGVDSQFIRARGLLGVCVDAANKVQRRLVERDQPTRGV